MKSMLAQSPTYYLNYRCIQNGEPKFLQLRIVNVGAKDRIAQVVMGTRSIDEEVLQELKQKQLLEDALRTARLAEVAKNAFLSNMSHDMRTPLNAIFGYASLAEKNLNDAQAVREYLGKIETAGKQMLDLIAKVLEFSYTESQECRITETRCNLGAVLTEVYETALPQAKDKKLHFSLNPNPPVCREVSCDGEKLKQLLTHLVNNAIQFTEPEGSVTLTAAEEPTLLGEYVTYRFRVEDTGIGIRQDDLERIFEPFERVGNTTASGKYGSGLGLTIAKRIAERMGGELKAESAFGKGSTFTLTLCFRLLAPA
ncbi:MAG: HAMP domain-containing histidine kinase, partial [Clostridia bacterium]|nr:HAMP domain-containing histidine kinase [Clostridia bacterium]